MESLRFVHRAASRLAGDTPSAIVGVVASGNLEVLAERDGDDLDCTVSISTAATGFGEIWEAVVTDFVARAGPGGVRFSINDGGARPDTVMLRLLQAARALERAPGRDGAGGADR